MLVQGRDCALTVTTANKNIDIPFTEETIRESFTLLEENPAIEGSGECRAIKKSAGTAGCIVTPLTLGNAPFLFSIALGDYQSASFVSETRNLYWRYVYLVPVEESSQFDIYQERGASKKRYPACRVKSFELRIMRGSFLKLKLDITGTAAPEEYFNQ